MRHAPRDRRDGLLDGASVTGFDQLLVSGPASFPRTDRRPKSTRYRWPSNCELQETVLAACAFRGILQFLNRQYGEMSQDKQAEKLGLRQPQVSQYSTAEPRSPRWWAKCAQRLFDLGRKQGRRETASRFMAALGGTFGEIPQAELAQALGVSQAAVSKWLTGTSQPSPDNFERLLGLHVLRLAEPIVEFRPVQPVQRGRAWHFYADRAEEKKLRDALRGNVGI